MMEEEQLLSLLEETAHRLGVAVRYEKLEGGDVPVKDGFCRVKGKGMIIMDKRHPLHTKIRLLAEAVAALDSEDSYLPPVVRELLEKVKGEARGEEGPQ